LETDSYTSEKKWFCKNKLLWFWSKNWLVNH
jgi:hypothetical protein